jgi:hypothetical protein
VENHYPRSVRLNERRARRRDSHREGSFSIVLLIIYMQNVQTEGGAFGSVSYPPTCGSEGGVLNTVHCFGGTEACGIRGPNGSVLSRGAMVSSSSFVPSAVVAGRIPLPSGVVVVVPTPPPPTGDCFEVWSSFIV